MDRFAASATSGIGRMSAKNLALALNSLAQRKGFDSFFEAAVDRILELCEENHEFHTQVSLPCLCFLLLVLMMECFESRCAVM